MTRRAALLLLVPLVAAACGGDDDDGTATAPSTTTSAPACDVVGDTEAAPASDLEVTLDEWSIAAGEATAGPIRFVVANEGDVEHELAIKQVGGKLLGEIEPFASGSTCEGTFDLAAGTYKLFCEIEDESGMTHEAAGMVTELTVK
jgi:plastocyanin